MALSTHSTGTPPNARVSLSTHCLASSSEGTEPGSLARRLSPRKEAAALGRCEAAAEVEELHTARLGKGGDIQPSTPPGKASTPADDRKSAIVTARKPGPRSSSDVPDMTPEEHKRRGDAADAMFREIKRRVAGDLP